MGVLRVFVKSAVGFLDLAATGLYRNTVPSLLTLPDGVVTGFQ